MVENFFCQVGEHLVNKSSKKSLAFDSERQGFPFLWDNLDAFKYKIWIVEVLRLVKDPSLSYEDQI